MKTLVPNPKPEIRTPKEDRNPKPESNLARRRGFSEFRLRTSFGIRSSVFGILWVLYFCFLLSALCFWASGQFAIDWHTIDGGGGTSTGGIYSVSGTIGQPDAGEPMTNGPYTLTGGFWVLPTAVQTEGAPTLTIVQGAPGFANISWTPALTNWILQERSSLNAGSWTNSPSGSTNPVVVPATVPTKFYRLFKP